MPLHCTRIYLRCFVNSPKGHPHTIFPTIGFRVFAYLLMRVSVFSLLFLSSFLSYLHGSMAYGTEYGLVIVDIVQKICLLNIASPDLYGAQDPYARTPRSPKRTETGASRDEQARSPSIDQVCTNLFQM